MATETAKMFDDMLNDTESFFVPGEETDTKPKNAPNVRGEFYGHMQNATSREVEWTKDGKTFKNKNIDCVVHLASLSNAEKSFSNPKKFMDSGMIGTFNLLEICKINDIKKFIYMSSLTVHGKINYEIDEKYLDKKTKSINIIAPRGHAK